MGIRTVVFQSLAGKTIPYFWEKLICMRNAFFLFLFFGVTSCKGQAVSTLQVGADEFEKALTARKVQLLDVRTAKEFTNGHIKNALQADWTNNKEFTDRVQYIDKDKPVYIYCLVGSRSAAAATWMRDNGFKNVIELAGGINAWKQAEKPIEGSINQAQMTMEEFKKSIPATGTALVDVGASWCPPCVKMEPVLQDIIADKKFDFTFIKIDAGVHTNLLKEMNIEPIPVFIIYKDGQEIWRKQGIVSKDELKEQLKRSTQSD